MQVTVAVGISGQRGSQAQEGRTGDQRFLDDLRSVREVIRRESDVTCPRNGKNQLNRQQSSYIS